MLSISTHDPEPEAFAMPTSTLTQTITVYESIPKTRAPIPTFLPNLNSPEYFDFVSGPWQEGILCVAILGTIYRVAKYKFVDIAQFFNAWFQDWLDVLQGPKRSFTARAVFWSMVAVYSASLTNVGLLGLEHLSQLWDLWISIGEEHIGLVGPDWKEQLWALAVLLSVHLLQSNLTARLVKFRELETRKPRARLIEPLWWILLVIGLSVLGLSEYCAGALGYKGAFTLVTDLLLIWVIWVVSILDESFKSTHA